MFIVHERNRLRFDIYKETDGHNAEESTLNLLEACWELRSSGRPDGARPSLARLSVKIATKLLRYDLDMVSGRSCPIRHRRANLRTPAWSIFRRIKVLFGGPIGGGEFAALTVFDVSGAEAATPFVPASGQRTLMVSRRLRRQTLYTGQFRTASLKTRVVRTQ